MWKNQKVSVILPTYNEKDSMYQSILEFSIPEVDEIIVINNNAAEGTDEEVRKTNARLVHEEEQGFGAAIQRGLKEAIGDIIIVAEPDGTFMGQDVYKLLAYSDDFEIVFGSRTCRILVWDNANMGKFLRWGNFAVAKMVEVLFNTTTLTDVGCTMRLLKRSALDKISPQFTVRKSHFNPEMLVLTIINKLNFIEIPLNYRPRVGMSSVTGNHYVAFKLGMRMIFMIWGYWFKSIFGRKKK